MQTVNLQRTQRVLRWFAGTLSVAALAGCAGGSSSPYYSPGFNGSSRSFNTEPAPAVRDDDARKRGNTPPGKDRAGGGPATGAIIDPAGVISR